MVRSSSGPLVCVVVIAALAAACTAAATGSPSGVSGTNPPTAPPSGTPTASPSGPSSSVTRPSFPAVSFPVGSPGAGITLPAAVLEPVLADAAARSGVPREQLVVVSAESRTWSDGSLGCPVPGQVYTQALVEGWQAVVRARTTLYDYHGAGLTTFKLCKAVPG
jgi:hypothetical protein